MAKTSLATKKCKTFGAPHQKTNKIVAFFLILVQNDEVKKGDWVKRNEKREKVSVKMEKKIQVKGKKKLCFPSFGVKYSRILKKRTVREDENTFVKTKFCGIIFVENVHFNFKWNVLV